jgi:hypothetical protein
MHGHKSLRVLVIGTSGQHTALAALPERLINSKSGDRNFPNLSLSTEVSRTRVLLLESYEQATRVCIQRNFYQGPARL